MERIGLSVLIAEDDPSNREMLLCMCRDLFSCQCDAVGDGMEAVNKCKGSAYDVVILDHHMPKLDGKNAAFRIKSEGVSQDAYTIVISGDTNALSGVCEESSSINSILYKPFMLNELHSKLSFAANKRRV